MKSLIWKELRENLKWAVLAFVVLIVAEFYALLLKNNHAEALSPLLKGSFQITTMFGNASIGFILALLQILPEQRRDRWASLMHLPVSRTTIFFGKAITGLILYFLAVTVPFIACVVYVNLPGKFAVPFTPGLMNAGFIDILAGALYYMTGLFIGLRRGPWYGSRILGLVVALITSTVTSNIPFSMAIWVIVFVTLSLLGSALGAIRTNGSFYQQPWWAKTSLIFVFILGSFTMTVFLCLLSMGLSDSSPSTSRVEYDVLEDGRPVRITYVEGEPTFNDLSGTALHEIGLGNNSYRNHLLTFWQVSNFIGNSHDGPYHTYLYRVASYHLQKFFVSEVRNKEDWFYLKAERTIVGYDSKSKIRIGSIGEDGFHPGWEISQPFHDQLKPAEGHDEIIPFYFVLGKKICFFNVEKRELETIYFSSDSPIYGLSTPYVGDGSTTKSSLFVALEKQTLVLDAHGNTVATLPYHQDMDHFGSLSVGMISKEERFFLKYSPSTWQPYETKGRMPRYLEEMNAQGNVMNTYTLPANATKTQEDWGDYLGESALPPVFWGVTLVRPGKSGDIQDTTVLMFRVLIVSSILAILTFIWARYRHFSWQRAVVWSVLVLGFNLAGLITFVLAADWPVLKKCPQCSLPRDVSKENCVHCHSSWPSPKVDGTEIFETNLIA